MYMKKRSINDVVDRSNEKRCTKENALLYFLKEVHLSFLNLRYTMIFRPYVLLVMSHEGHIHLENAGNCGIDACKMKIFY
jgi:hypothetical protein